MAMDDLRALEIIAFWPASACSLKCVVTLPSQSSAPQHVPGLTKAATGKQRVKVARGKRRRYSVAPNLRSNAAVRRRAAWVGSSLAESPPLADVASWYFLFAGADTVARAVRPLLFFAFS